MRVLLVDDDPRILHAFTRQLNGHEVKTASGFEEARAVLDGFHPDVVLTDYDLGNGTTGLDVLREAQRRCPRARRYVASGNVTNVPDEAHELAYAVLSKGSDNLIDLLGSLAE